MRLPLGILTGMLPKLHRATLSLTVAAEGPVPELTREALGVPHLKLLDRRWLVSEHRQISRYDVRYRGEEGELLEQFERLAFGPSIVAAQWSIQTPE
jgi:hypothetical protein